MEIDRRTEASDAPTRERVVRSILENGPSTAAALGERLDLTPAAVRRHLDHLLAEGAIEAREPRSSTVRGRGRPAKVFALTEGGHAHFDQQYDDLAVQALRFLAETGGESAVRAFAERRVAFIEAEFADVIAANPGISRAEALARVFTSEGYAARTRATKSTTRAFSSASEISTPGAALMPPMSTISAPCSTTSATRSNALSSAQVAPRS